jgi:hypothetical protein
MPLVAIITIIGVLLTVVVLVGCLIRVALVLARVSAKLGPTIVGLHLIIAKTEPIKPIVGEINKDLTGVDTALRAVLAR